MATRGTSRSAYTWKQFFKVLADACFVKNTENYVSTFSTQFKLKPAEYQLGERRVIL